MGDFTIEIKTIQNGFTVKFYDGTSLSVEGDYMVFCDSWRAVTAAISQWKSKFGGWLDSYPALPKAEAEES
ncbi:MAG: hypothetical protein ACQCN6_01495 [Candidatus Bathyarchaeia archaeon]